MAEAETSQTASCGQMEDFLDVESSLIEGIRKLLEIDGDIKFLDEVDGKFEKRVLTRGDDKVCPLCEKTIISKTFDEAEGDDEEDGGDETGTRIHVAQVDIKCTISSMSCGCHGFLPFVPKDRETYVLQGTCIMQRYVRYRASCSRRQRCTSPKMDGKEEEMTLLHLGTIDIQITDASYGYAQLNIGAKLATLQDENGHIRHFIDEVTPNSPAAKMKIKVEDEVMLLNDTLLVDRQQTDIQQLFLDIKTDVEFRMLNRRMTNRRSRLDFNKPDEVNYEYLKVKALVSTKEQCLATEASITHANLGVNEILLMTDADKRQVHIKLDRDYLQSIDGKLTLNPNLRANIPGFKFEMLSYDFYEMKPKDKKAGKEGNPKVLLFRQENDDGAYSFVYLGDGGQLEMRTAPDMFSTPTKRQINNAMKNSNFAVQNAAFISSPVSKAGYIFTMKIFTKKDSYVTYDSKKKSFCLFSVDKSFRLVYMDNVKFNVIILQGTQHNNKQGPVGAP